MKHILLLITLFISANTFAITEKLDSGLVTNSNVEKLVDKYSAKISATIVSLAESLKQPAEHVYRILVKQQVVKAITFTISLLLGIILLIVFCFICYNISYETPLPTFTPYKEYKSHFQSAYKHILQWEGGYVNHPNDKGGETYAGITKLWNADWNGWKHVGDTTNSVILEMWVKDYYLDVWVSEGFDKIKDESLAIYLFDFRIHTSRKTIVKICNRILPKIGRNHHIKNREEWIPILFNKVNPVIFKSYIEEERIKFYKYLVTKDKSQKVFLKGWLRRAES